MRAPTRTPRRSRLALVLSACGALAALGLAAEGRADGPPKARWTAATPDAMAEAALARAARGGDDALAGLVVAAALDERASFGKVRAGLAALAAGGGPLASEARLLGRVLAPAPAPEPWVDLATRAYDVAPDPDGLVRSFAVLGPFRDPGDGLARREGPEAPAERWSNGAADYSWGAYTVTWRRALPESATARGLPLDLYVSPRTETCSYLASKVTLPAGTASVVAHVASTGTVRVIWDGADVGLGAEVHPRLVLDRLAVR
ncbi:MAG: hypothetical protein IT373_04925, partial [Polyangiaceae bacterium]|nr:hypothetical protein [Polyangiaceae bacterium]